MHLSIKESLNREIIHYADDYLCVSSTHNRVFIRQSGQETMIQLPGDGWKTVFGTFRLGRRAFRLDKCNVIPVDKNLVIIRQGLVYHYDTKVQCLTPTLKLKNCRNVLHQSILVTENSDIYFGEYGNNASRAAVPVYRSQDGGKSWHIIFKFPAGTIKHVHGCYWDPFEQKIWVFTGDFAGECHLLCADQDFNQLEWVGDGQQVYRTCNAFFEPDSIHWIMDSQLEDSYHIRMDRKTRQVEKVSLFPGPVWYIKKLSDGCYLAATAQEIGPGVHDRYSHIMLSRDLTRWEDVFKVSHDGLPKRFFKFGVIGFADGSQSSQGFYMFAEALTRMDGRSFLCQVVE
jgi:hypothetical protein